MGIIKKNLKFFIGIIISVLILFFGNAILMKPKIEIACGSVDLMMPAKLKLELMSIRMLLMQENMAKKFKDDFGTNLEQLGMSKEKTQLIIESLETNDEKVEKTEKKKKKEEDIKFEPHEEKIAEVALAKAMASMPKSMAEQIEIPPDTVAFFQIRNKGLSDAKDVHVVVRLGGNFFSERIESDNKIISKESKGNIYEIDLASLSPKAKIRGMIWYNSSRNEALFRTNSITVTYKDGLKEANFEKDIFFIKD